MSPLTRVVPLLSLTWMCACDDLSMATAVTGAGGATTATTSSFASSTASGTGGAADPHWSCLGEVEWPVIPAIPLKFVLGFHDMYDVTKKLSGAAVRLCPRSDISCDAPQATGVTNDQGEATLELDLPAGTQGWDGYAEVTPAAGSGYPVNLVVFTRPASNDPKFANDIIDQQAIDAGVTILTGAPPDPTMGVLAMTVLDCAHELAAGTTIAIAPAGAAKIGYFKNGVPKPSAVATDESGIAAVANVTPGFVTVTSTRVATGETMGVVEVPVRAGAITTFGFDPTPLP